MSKVKLCGPDGFEIELSGANVVVDHDGSREFEEVLFCIKGTVEETGDVLVLTQLSGQDGGKKFYEDQHGDIYEVV